MPGEHSPVRDLVRDLAVIAALTLLVAYEMSPDVQSWVNYQLLRGRQWVRYAFERARFELRSRGVERP